jgi:hypothetical protein
MATVAYHGAWHQGCRDFDLFLQRSVTAGLGRNIHGKNDIIRTGYQFVRTGRAAIVPDLAENKALTDPFDAAWGPATMHQEFPLPRTWHHV